MFQDPDNFTRHRTMFAGAIVSFLVLDSVVTWVARSDGGGPGPGKLTEGVANSMGEALSAIGKVFGEASSGPAEFAAALALAVGILVFLGGLFRLVTGGLSARASADAMPLRF